MARLFLGLRLPETYQRMLPALTTGLANLTGAGVRWTPPGNWHLTLKFLGETDEARIPGLRGCLREIHYPAFTMSGGAPGVFPNIKRPRVFWLGLATGADQCAGLAKAIEGRLADVGFEREKKQFRPHLTIGRVRRPGPGNWQEVLDRAGERAWPEFTVDRFVLWQSTLMPTGAVHTPLEEFPLG